MTPDDTQELYKGTIQKITNLFLFCFIPVEMTPDDTQELYKGTIQKIIDRWRENEALKDPDVDWVSSQILFLLLSLFLLAVIVLVIVFIGGCCCYCYSWRPPGLQRARPDSLQAAAASSATTRELWINNLVFCFSSELSHLDGAVGEPNLPKKFTF